MFAAILLVMGLSAGAASTSCIPMDSKVEVNLMPLQDNELYTLSSETKDSRQITWRYGISGSKKELMEFLKKQADRLLFEMKPLQGDRDASYLVQPLRNNAYKIEVKNQQGEVVLAADFCRDFWTPEKSERRMVDESDLQGVFYRPKFQAKSPALIRFGGSEGGISSLEGGLLANQGIASLTVGYHRGYYNNQNLPENLVEIPVELVKRALQWLQQQDSVDLDQIYIYGVSRGSELALLGAAHYPEIKGVIAVAPSAVVWDGLFRDKSKYKPLSSWTWQAQALDFVAPIWADEFSKPRPWTYVDAFRKTLAVIPAESAAWLPVEKIQGKILLISGTEDKLWPSAQMSEQLVERAKKDNPTKDIVHLKYEGAGHLIGIPYLPSPLKNDTFWYGGNQDATARASQDSWLKIIKFIKGKPL
ncbi:hypothetical protein D3C87_257020 [compost metagenome]